MKAKELIKLYQLQMYNRGKPKIEDVRDEQLNLFTIMMVDEPEEVVVENEEVIEIMSYKRLKNKKEKHIDYSYLPHKIIVHEPSEEV